ncbi:leucine-rich repeat-containing protein typical subtype : Repeat-companion domain protein OS=Isosphaera pallida (strain ATCC 43644 / DSM 9630 / IS1B) GN=Isop_0537 PE=4 SV=1: LRR_6: LRR_6 [Gemmataceae bacterium]|nr:leucine-rich repeat-containing protein typical subtype : Repeat-companion domain protein OS=Isosphaera pallida (strain ATCC 43644 / DSM 9630 / IS1B) GN=Isop_0537 PE=4 SV=1: LRR_6: LRR_6 [Gemmataceae bacterium]VTU00050.1 leucine-rich repeat-containing protein typical subtype : Repeat-companion domain protein OS=Isosphaera pallida (strain ATCC 43644 / DSM 9630 / IS1B) GN=Isop_0537 PE=4 SV=1: LRR_6: LRR_6 [Gemmataceae bacterium]
MSDEDAFLAAIATAPDEDTPRLAYADWLDEHDRPTRAEFIRTQIEIARKEHLPRAVLHRYADLFKRNQDLIEFHRGDLLGPLAALPAGAVREFRRGFASQVSLAVGDFLAHADQLAAARPLPRVTVSRVAARLGEFVRSPHLGCVTRLELYSAALEGAFLWPGDADVIAGAQRLTRLDALDLEGCRVNDDHLDLASRCAFPALTDLDLSNNELTDYGVENLLATGWPRHLTRLVLGGNPIGDDGAFDLAERWPAGDADKLTYLNLRFTNVGPRGQQALLARFGGRLDLF